jgi:Flp pilus assembly protein TadB
VAVAFVGGAGLAAIGTTVALAWSFRMSSTVHGDTYVIFPIYHLRYWIWAAALIGGLLLAWLAVRRRP